jgi:hypothetical protein
MAVICPVCSSTPSIRGDVDADIVRHLSLRNIASKYGLSVRAVQRHLKHLPHLLETASAPSGPGIYVGGITYNFYVCATTPEEEAEEEEQAADDGGQEDLLGNIAEQGGGDHA